MKNVSLLGLSIGLIFLIPSSWLIIDKNFRKFFVTLFSIIISLFLYIFFVQSIFEVTLIDYILLFTLVYLCLFFGYGSIKKRISFVYTLASLVICLICSIFVIWKFYMSKIM